MTSTYLSANTIFEQEQVVTLVKLINDLKNGKSDEQSRGEILKKIDVILNHVKKVIFVEASAALMQ